MNLKQAKVLLIENINKSAINYFQEKGFENIKVIPQVLKPQELEKEIADVDILGIRSATWIKEELLEKAKKLLAIGCFIVEVNKVDLISTEKRGIPVFHGPFSSTRSVAELTIGLIFSLFRKIGEKNLAAHQGKWLKKTDGLELRSKTLGIIGFSNIGSQVGQMAESLGMKVIFYDVANVLSFGNCERKNHLDEVLRESDVITVHVPSLPATKGMINAKAIAKMKKGSFIINTSRGDITDEQAICDALKSGHLSGVALDVFAKEPKSLNEELESPLKNFPGAILTPHIGGSTKEAQRNIGEEVAKKLIDFLQIGKTADAINFPRVYTSSPQKNIKRIIHIHKNIPGMLTGINDIFSSKNINISSQNLKTSQHIGYAVLDIEGQCDQSIQEKLKNLPGTIRCNIL